jgi:hypothetical protein
MGERNIDARAGLYSSWRRVLLQRSGRSDFVALRADYPQVGFVPPHLFVQELNITLNGRVQTVRWRTASAISVAAESFTFPAAIDGKPDSLRE